MQNVSGRRLDEFLGIVSIKPEELLRVLKYTSLERGNRINQDWLIRGAFYVAGTDEGWPIVAEAIHGWLRCYNKDPYEQTNRYPRHTPDDDAQRLNRRRGEIQGVLCTLSSFEANVMENMTEVSGETDSLLNLALRLLAGRPLAPFAQDFIAFGLSLALDPDTWSARKAFHQLTMFNRVDPTEAGCAFLKALQPLRDTEASLAGKWTIVRMLYAAGTEAAAVEAASMAERLNEHNMRFSRPSGGWREADIADPECSPPTDLEAAVSYFLGIPTDTLLQQMGQRKEDHDFEELLPIACRFAPAVAVEKSRSVILGLLSRLGLPLRQLIFNGTGYVPLLSSEDARLLAARVRGSNPLTGFRDQEVNVARMILLLYVAPHLEGSEQLECVLDRAFGEDYLFDLIPALKGQPIHALAGKLEEALSEQSEDIAYRVLVVARHAGIGQVKELEPLLLRCLRADSSKLRAISYELALLNSLSGVRQAVASSTWSGLTSEGITYEAWFGSMLIVEACANGEVALESILPRINPQCWLAAVDRLGSRMSKPFAEWFLRRLKEGADIAASIAPPSVDFTYSKTEPAPYAFLSIDESDRETGAPSRRSNAGSLLGLEEDFESKQERLRAAAQSFFESLKNKEGPRLLIEPFELSQLRTVLATDQRVLPQLLETLENASDDEFLWLRNLALCVGCLISADMPERAVRLFRRSTSFEGFVSLDLGDGLTAEHQAIWASSPTDLMMEFWKQRLFRSGNDSKLAQEVLAAERFGAASFINRFVVEGAASDLALERAYAITVAGFSRQYLDQQSFPIIDGCVDEKGMTGDAARGAKKARDNARWARVWMDRAFSALSAAEFWCNLMILKSCADARVDASPHLKADLCRYAPQFRNMRRLAIRERNRHREKTFLGQSAPESAFVLAGNA